MKRRATLAVAIAALAVFSFTARARAAENCIQPTVRRPLPDGVDLAVPDRCERTAGTSSLVSTRDVASGSSRHHEVEMRHSPSFIPLHIYSPI